MPSETLTRRGPLADRWPRLQTPQSPSRSHINTPLGIFKPIKTKTSWITKQYTKYRDMYIKNAAECADHADKAEIRLAERHADIMESIKRISRDTDGPDTDRLNTIAYFAIPVPKHVVVRVHTYRDGTTRPIKEWAYDPERVLYVKPDGVVLNPEVFAKFDDLVDDHIDLASRHSSSDGTCNDSLSFLMQVHNTSGAAFTYTGPVPDALFRSDDYDYKEHVNRVSLRNDGSKLLDWRLDDKTGFNELALWLWYEEDPIKFVSGVGDHTYPRRERELLEERETKYVYRSGRDATPIKMRVYKADPAHDIYGAPYVCASIRPKFSDAPTDFQMMNVKLYADWHEDAYVSMNSRAAANVDAPWTVAPVPIKVLTLSHDADRYINYRASHIRDMLEVGWSTILRTQSMIDVLERAAKQPDSYEPKCKACGLQAFGSGNDHRSCIVRCGFDLGSLWKYYLMCLDPITV